MKSIGLKTIIIGAGGHGRVILDILRQLPGVEPHGFVDDREDLVGQWVNGLPVLGGRGILKQLREQGISGAVVGVGDNEIRSQIF